MSYQNKGFFLSNLKKKLGLQTLDLIEYGSLPSAIKYKIHMEN